MFEKVMWALALPSSVVFVIQMVMTFAGMDGDGVSADFSGDINSDVDLGGSHDVQHDAVPFQIFTFRNFINFFLAFGWTGIALYPIVQNKLMVVLISSVSGIALVAIVVFIFYSLSKATQSGNINLNNALNKKAQVYLTIPPSNSGIGKIQMEIQGSIREYDAVTDGEKIPTGQTVKVTGISNNNILMVEKT
jgi:hypothetical protein